MCIGDIADLSEGKPNNHKKLTSSRTFCTVFAVVSKIMSKRGLIQHRCKGLSY